MLETSTSFALGERSDPRADVDGHAADVVADELALAGVEAGPHFDAERPAPGRRSRAHSGSRARAVERGEEAVAHGLHLAAPVALELRANQLVVAGHELAPARIAKGRRALGGADDVGEHHGGEDAIGRKAHGGRR